MEERDDFIFGKNAVLAYLEQSVQQQDAHGQPNEDAGKEIVNQLVRLRAQVGPSSFSFKDVKQIENPGTIRVNKILLAEGQRFDERLRKIHELARLQKIPITNCDRRKLDQLAGPEKRHQGIIALISPSKMWTMETLLQKIELDRLSREQVDQSMSGYTLALLDGVEDPHNLGAIIRVAEASGVKAVLISQRRSPGLTATVAKISAGAVASLPVVRVSNLVQAIETLKQYGFWVVGLDASAETVLTDADLQRPLLTVIGSEGRGIGRLVKEHCDFLVKIPMLGNTESLNASVAAGVFFYEVVRQCRRS